MDFKNLESIYKYLKPADLAGALKLQNPTVPEDVHDLVVRMIMNPKGVMYTYETIKNELDNHFKTKLGSDKEKRKFSDSLHFIGKEQLNLADKEYWKDPAHETVIKSISDLIPKSNDNGPTASNFLASCMVVRSPYVTPSTRGVDSVDFFLNYTPPIVANQMMPYLDVEFKLTSTSKDYLNLPSPMRFMMGTVPTSALSPIDKAIADSNYAGEIKTTTNVNGEKSEVVTHSSVMGMEMFLMPQGLTNMDELGPSKHRLVRAKPFTPFASLQSFDVSLQNAGAGAFAHKKGTLKFVLHDKSRISEMAEFIKGPSGFNQAMIWTTYGWLAPLNRGEHDEYSKFINDNLILRECWSVVNSQFSFDSAGQVTFTLDLVSKAAKSLEGITVSTADDQLLNFHKLIGSIQQIKNKILGENKFAINVTSEQILNAAASNGMIANMEKIKDNVNTLIASLTNSALPVAEREALSSNLQKLVGDGEFSQKNVEKMIGNSVHKDFKNLNNIPDPFLPTGAGGKQEYFDDDLIGAIAKYNGTSEDRAKAIREANKGASGVLPVDMSGVPPVVSFGKLFLNFVVPAVMKTQSCDELQVFFYGLNGECGPASYHSIAEFPINMTALSYAYAELLKSTNTEALSLQTFLKLIIDTNFADVRGIGYGMTSFHNPLDPRKLSDAVRSDNLVAEKGMIEWHEKYGDLRIPMIEMYIETGEENEAVKSTVESIKAGATRIQQKEQDLKSGGDKKIIKRIHIYDKQNNPYRLAQQIIDSGNDKLEVGEVNKGKVEGKLKKIIGDATPQQLIRLKELLESEKLTYREAFKRIANEDGVSKGKVKAPKENKFTEPAEINRAEIVKQPAGDKIEIGRNRASLKAQLMRTLPCLSIGTNGSMILTSNVASKTDGLMGAINIMNAGKGTANGVASAPDNNLGEAGGLPLRVSPVQVTMTTVGVPTAALYQTFFIDFDTGTSLDNIYNCTQLQHSISPGKFTTNWTFMYANGYGKFSNPPTVDAVVNGQLLVLINKELNSKPK